MKNILFLVTGKTPQIVTETVWALACDPEVTSPWIPDEIHILSTEDGLNQVRSRLFSEKEQFRFQRFQQDFPQLRQIKFEASEQHLHVFKDEHGVILSDLKTPKDNEIAANLICKMVREFTQDDSVNLHVSIAGGRKTMGFYAGYALSLYGRKQDRMSHVLVDDRYESARDFFYPTPNGDVFVTNRDGMELQAKEGKVWLANIPFVRMRNQLTDEKVMTDSDFSDIVDFINVSYETPKIYIYNNADRLIVINDKQVKLSPKEFSLYLLAAEMNLAKKSFVYPSKEIAGDSIEQQAQSRFNEIYDMHKTGSGKNEVIMDYDNFGQTLSNIKSKFKKAFGTIISDKIIIQKLENSEYGIALEPENIEIIK